MQDRREWHNTHNIVVVFSELWSSSDINDQKWWPGRLIWSTFCTRGIGNSVGNLFVNAKVFSGSIHIRRLGDKFDHDRRIATCNNKMSIRRRVLVPCMSNDVLSIFVFKEESMLYSNTFCIQWCNVCPKKHYIVSTRMLYIETHAHT